MKAIVKDGKSSEIIEGKIIYENDYFYTIQGKHYRTCISKLDILTGDAVIL